MVEMMARKKKVAIRISYDELTGEVLTVDCSKRFLEEGSLFRLDVIKDSIEALEFIYEIERDKYFSNNKRVARA